MPKTKNCSLEVACPCCGARLTIDSGLRKVIAHEPPPPRRTAAPDFDKVGALLREQAERREALFRQSAEDEKSKTELLEKKFAEALRKSKGQPIEKPTRDIDLD